MAKIVSFSNQKGGVGKTTSCVNISAQIANKGKRVLMIDMDPQGNATSGLGLAKSKIKRTVYDVIIGRCDIKDAVIKTRFKNLSVVPANIISLPPRERYALISGSLASRFAERSARLFS